MAEEEKKRRSGNPSVLTWFIIVFVGAFAAFVFTKILRESGPKRFETDKDRLLALAKSHPDERIREDFVDAVANGTLQLRVDRPIDGASGSFQTPGGQPTIVIDPSVISATATSSGEEIAYGVLSHEFRHYRQWREMPAMREMHAMLEAKRTLTPAQCLLKAAVEDEAYGQTCAEANRFHWTVAAPLQCEQIGLTLSATRLLRANALPECLETWKSLTDQPPSEAAPSPPPPSPPPAEETLPMIPTGTRLAPP